MFALLDHLGIRDCKGVGISAGGNVLLHMAIKPSDRVQAMVLVSATPYFPAQARPFKDQYPDSCCATHATSLKGQGTVISSS